MTILSAITSATTPASEPVATNLAFRAAKAPATTTAAAGSLFTASLEGAAKDLPAPKTDSAVPDARPINAVYRGSKSGELSPVQQFESFVLRSFVETMLPKENSSFFGTGTAGQIWKSMLAERIGDEMARDGGIGIADMLAKRGTGAAAADAQQALAKTDALSVDALKLDGAGSL